MWDTEILKKSLQWLTFLAWSGTGIAALVALSAIFRTRVFRVIQAAFLRYSVEDMLVTIMGVAYDDFSFPADAEVRMTVYLPHGSKTLIQAINYVPRNLTGKGRRLETSKGIAGRAFREGRSAYIEILPYSGFSTAEALREHLVDRWGFTRSEAKALESDRRAFFAAPIRHGCDVIGVLYADSPSPDAFPPETIDRVQPTLDFLAAILSHRSLRRSDLSRRATPSNSSKHIENVFAKYLERGWQRVEPDDDAHLLTRVG